MNVDEAKKTIVPVLKHRGVRRAGLFGSLVRGEDRPDSDVDVLVDVDDSLSLLDIVGLKNELEDKLGRNVDLVEYEAIKPVIRKQILSEQVIIL